MPETKTLFNNVAKNYDMLNTFFSMGIDRLWRKRLVQEIGNAGLVLDIATGTAEVAVEALNQLKNSYAVGLDPSVEMLEIGRKKHRAHGIENRATLLPGVAENLAFKDNTFDAVTIAFGIRNTVDPKKSLMEMNRVLKPGAKIAILEFAVPRNKIFSPAYMFYLKNLMPLVGSLFGTKKEYKYLGDSISIFPQRESFVELMEGCGFNLKKTIELTMGTVIIYVGIKRASN